MLDEMDYRLPRESLYEIIADRVEEQLVGGNVEKLPSESALAQSFGVSRPVIREALKLLKARGLIAQRRGGATEVRVPGIDFMQDVVERFVKLKQLDVRDIYEVRLCIEPYAARQAARRIDAQGVDALLQMYETMCAVKDDPVRRVAVDAELHLKIAELSGNSLLAAMAASMSGLVMQQMGAHIENVSVPEHERVGFHKEIIDALAEGDEALAEALSRLHLMHSMQGLGYDCEEEH